MINVRSTVLTLIAFAGLSPSATAQQDTAYSAVTLGTSLTLRGGWTDTLATGLAECRGQTTTVTVVAGAGQNSSWGLAQLPKVLSVSPDLVIIEFAMNDASLVHGVSETEARDNISRMVAQLRASKPDVTITLISTNPAYGWGWTSRFGLDSYYSLNASLADELDTLYLDLRQIWAARDTNAEIPDGVHPTPEAAREVFVPAIIGLLRDEGLCPANNRP